MDVIFDGEDILPLEGDAIVILTSPCTQPYDKADVLWGGSISNAVHVKREQHIF